MNNSTANHSQPRPPSARQTTVTVTHNTSVATGIVYAR